MPNLKDYNNSKQLKIQMSINNSWCKDFNKTNHNLRTSVTTKVIRIQISSSSSNSIMEDNNNKPTRCLTKEWNQKKMRIRTKEQHKKTWEVELIINLTTNFCFKSWIRSVLSNNKLRIKATVTNKKRMARWMISIINNSMLWVKRFRSNHSKFRIKTKETQSLKYNRIKLPKLMNWMLKSKKQTKFQNNQETQLRIFQVVCHPRSNLD